MPKLTNVQAVNAAIFQEMERDDKVLILGEDVGFEGGVFRATDNIQKKFGKDRAIDSPLAESGIIGSAIGMAINGLKPVCEIQFFGFLWPGFDQLMSHAARYRHRSMSSFNLPMVIRMPCGAGIRAPEHHSENWEAILCHHPGIKVIQPAFPIETKGLLAAAIRDPDPVIFLEHKKIYRSIKQEVPDEEHIEDLDKAKIQKEGTDVSVITYGAMVHTALEVAETLKKEIDVEVLDLRTLSPIDEQAIVQTAKKTGRVVVFHEACKTGGVGAEVSARISDHLFYELQAPVQRVTGYDVFVPPFMMENSYIPGEKRLTEAVRKVATY